MKRAVWTSAVMIISMLLLGLLVSSCTPAPPATTVETTETATPSIPVKTPEPEITGPVETVMVSLTEWSVKLDKTSVNAGNIKFVVTNNGQKYPHAIKLISKSTGKATGSQVAVTLDEVDTMTVNLPAGVYEVYCPLSGHKEKGMTTTLTVK